MADPGQRKFDTVLVWKLDRFGRSLRHLINALAELSGLHPLRAQGRGWKAR
jgi:DNA invertase Pin-like site-specific DNA recombinase